MIISTAFLSEFGPLYKPELFRIEYIRIVAEWCWSYYQNYEHAPGKDIQDIFQNQADQLKEELAESIETMLLNLSEEFSRDKTFNHKYALDKAEKYLQSRNYEALTREVELANAAGDLDKAEALVVNFNQVKRPETEGIDIFNDAEGVLNALQGEEHDTLFKLGGAAGRVMPDPARGQFIAFLGPEKRGKSWNLQTFIKYGLLNGCNVIEFNFEMTIRDKVKRFVQNLTGMPGKKEDEGCLIPVFDCELNQTGVCKRAKKLGINDVTLIKDGGIPPHFDRAPKNYKPCSICKNDRSYDVRQRYTMAIWYKRSTKKAITPTAALKKIKQLKPYIRGARYKLVTWPSDTKSIRDIKNVLDILEEKEGFIPDVIVTDYADLMVPDRKLSDFRHQTDNIWKGHKKLSQERHCLVVSATQATKDAHEKRLKKGSISEDKRKASHVDRFIGLNQTEEEKYKGILRWSVLFERHGSETKNDIVILQCLTIGNPYLDSYVDEQGGRKLKRTFKKR